MLTATIVFQKNWAAINAKNQDGTRKYRYIINRGSSRSSKTISIIDCFDLYAREQTNKRLTVWRDTKTDCRKTVLADILKRLKNTGRYKVGQDYNKTEAIFTYTTGSTYEIHGTDDENTVHGLTQDAAHFNEPYDISREVFDQIDQRTADFILIDYNPKEGHFVEDIMKDPRAIVIDSTFKDNPFCPEESRTKILSYQPVSMSNIVLQKLINEYDAKVYNTHLNNLNFTDKQIRELERCKANEDKNSANKFNWSVYGLGEKAERPNRIFHFEEITSTFYQDIKVPVYYGSDWGSVHPWAVGEAKYYDGCLYVKELNYECENTIKSKLNATERANIEGSDEGLVTWKFNKWNIDKNRPIICDNNRPGKILALRSSGWDYAIAAAKGPGSIKDGVDLVNSIKVYFTSDSENIKYEQENYSRQVIGGIISEDPEDLNNHHMDWIRGVALFLQKEGIINKI